MSKMDMHMHSSVSADGEISPRGLAELCCQEGVTLAALTDHNAVSGVPEFSWRGAQLGVRAIPGVELDCIADDLHLHILGYGIDITSTQLVQIEQNVHQMLKLSGLSQMEAIEALGMVFNRDEVMMKAKDGVVSVGMIAEAVLREPSNKNHPLLAPMLEGGVHSGQPLVGFYWDICSPGKPAFVPLHYITAEQAIQSIHASGGIAVLAHPGLNIGTNEAAINKLLALALDGIEVFSSYHTNAISSFYLQKAVDTGLMITGGSDFHGRIKPKIRLGEINFQGMEEQIREAVISAIPQQNFI